MLKKDVRIGGTYACKVSGNLTTVRITSARVKGWNAINTETNRPVRIPTAARLRGEVSPPSLSNTRPKRTKKDLVQKVTTEAPIKLKVLDTPSGKRLKSAMAESDRTGKTIGEVMDEPYTAEPPDLDAAIDDAVDILGEMREAVKDLPGQDDFMYRLDRCIQVLTDHIAY